MRVALYARVSTQEQGLRGISIDAQIAALDEWAKDKTIVDHYTDVGISAHKPASKRPELQRLLRDVERGKIDVVAFVRLDRWFRSVKEYYKVQDILDAHNVAWRAIQEDYETESSSGKFKVNVMLAVAQSEAERTGERVKAVNAFKRAKGEFCSGNTPIGLTLIDKKLAPSDDAWKVREMYSAYISAGSIYSAQTLLLSQGIRIGDGSLTYVLDNSNYLRAGVVDDDTWAKVRKLRSIPRPRATGTTHTYLFNGILFCSCGRRMTGMTSYGHAYYRCPGYTQERACSVKRCFREDDIEAFLLKEIAPACEQLNLVIQAKSDTPIDTAPLKRRLDKLTDLYLNDLISRDKYEAEYKSVSAQIAEAEAKPKPIDTAELMTALEAYHSLSVKARRAFWHNLISEIVLNGDDISFSLSFIS